MNIYFLVYDVDFDEEVTEVLDSCCVAGYTKWTRVLGKGERSDPKFDNAVWPGFNCSIMMAVLRSLIPIKTVLLPIGITSPPSSEALPKS